MLTAPVSDPTAVTAAPWELSQVLGAWSGCWCQQGDPHRLWESHKADRDKHFHSLFSVKQLRERKPSHVTGWGAPASASRREAGRGMRSGEGSRHYLSRWKPASSTRLRNPLCDRRLVSIVQVPHAASPPFAGPLILEYPALWCLLKWAPSPWLDRVCSPLTPCPCQPPASLTIILGSGTCAEWVSELMSRQMNGHPKRPFPCVSWIGEQNWL